MTDPLAWMADSEGAMSAVVELPPLDRWLARVRQIGAHRPHRADYAAYERFMAEFHRAFPQATADQYARAKHVAAAAAGVLIGYGEK